MPVETWYRPEFGSAVKDAIQNALGKLDWKAAARQTGISDVYIAKMADGKVPSRAIIMQFAENLPADLETLMVAAGFEQPKDVAKGVSLLLRRNGRLSPGAIAQIEELVHEALEREREEGNTES